MKNTKKSLILILCAVAIMVASVLGTLAYLTDRTSVKNTFTVGNVNITLDEAVTDSDGKIIDTDGDNVPDSRTEIGNNYHLLPGKEYVKDPMITVNGGSEESYVRMILTVYNASGVQALIDADNNGDNAVKDYADLFTGWDTNTWLYFGFTEDTAANTISFEFRHATPVSGLAPDGSAQSVALEPLFTAIKVPGYATNEQMAALTSGGLKIVVEGHAIQTASFANEAEAWAAFDQQHGA